MPEKPSFFVFDDWRIPQQYQHQASIDLCLTVVEKAAGSVPFDLEGQSDDVLLAFSQAAMIIVPDYDIEASLIFPNRVWASREFVKQVYRDFIKFCGEGGWLNLPAAPTADAPPPTWPDDPPEPEPEPETEGSPDVAGEPKKKRGRPRKDAVPA